MANVLVLLFVTLSAISTTLAQQTQLIISLNNTLTPITNSSWLSSSGLYAFGFYQTGNGYAVGIFLCGVPEKTVVWTANRDNPPVPRSTTLLFNGSLILQTGHDQDAYIADPPEPATSASMLDSGNFVLYNSSQQVIWQSFDYPTDTLLPGQRLSASKRQVLFSSVSEANKSTGLFQIKMQKDGNLVMYPVVEVVKPWHAYWVSETTGYKRSVTLNLDNDGRLYLLNDTISIRNFTNVGYPTEGTIYLVRIDRDGIFRLYMHSLTENNAKWLVLWSAPERNCPKGLCGLNGYCFRNKQDVTCQCLPGFKNVTSGCERSFAQESCENKDPTTMYKIQEVPNTTYEDASFSTLSLPTKEECGKACLEDCHCEAAFFADGKCRKQKLPLSFGTQQPDSSNTVLVKVGVASSSGNTGSRGIKKWYILVIICASCAVLVLVFVSVIVYRVCVKSQKLSPEFVELSDDDALRLFTYKELEQATSNFNLEIGRGAFGTVYKGTVKLNGIVVAVAVKKLQRMLAEGEEEFQNEIKAIGRTQHRNLVRLLGYCLDASHRLLVYEYMSNGSLADLLFTPGKNPTWKERKSLAQGIARGIRYLHEECEAQIIHCDIKPQNVLIDANGYARISDFGLAKLLKHDQTRTLIGIRGTRGYVAPEWHLNQPVTVKADVYSFGVVLLEVVCCRRSVDWSLPEEEAVLEEWVLQCFEDGELGKLVGGEEGVDIGEVEKLVKVGLWCIVDDPMIRPSMQKVLLMLEGIVDIPVPPIHTSFISNM